MKKEKLTLEEVVTKIDTEFAKYYNREDACEDSLYDNIESLIESYVKQQTEDMVTKEEALGYAYYIAGLDDNENIISFGSWLSQRRSKG